MKALKFTLSGETAFFKNPDVNTYLYFTYGNIHKIAILGIIGAAIGLAGYNFQKKQNFPQFYSELNSLNISIVPRNERGYIPKKVQVFNNSVGYASQEQGGNLIVKEQWLEKPIWDIYILIDDNKNMDKITHSFLNNSFIYMPYLGKNDHYANITGSQLVDLKETTSFEKVNSLFIKDYFEFKKEEKKVFNLSFQHEDMWKYEERLPMALEIEQNQYITVPFIFTNMKVQPKESCKLFAESEKILFFF
ncbi:type I-B CRISPR-associated protein Cas5b [Clostridium estertheticum]|uniref:type I-B CRISPR-associated protein Cas5b n=1 Tax=Clostridium estertheticum TaxID=238834 RepID=UPI001C0B11D9|nr:type I-B CRISPR-associated protein Cas5b [Clostridium estertheticum]MBU3187232.1 type I-B CRISPR-associated protein Cas5b [Clostridium estertheticum]MCB2358686.1 type I-B CRISPR-associated protein Cas5b [Clostridium estertheticum]